MSSVYSLSDTAEPVFSLPQIEGRFASLHDLLDRIPHGVNIDRPFSRYCATRLVSGCPMSAPGDKSGIAVHYKICIVTREYRVSGRLVRFCTLRP